MDGSDPSAYSLDHVGLAHPVGYAFGVVAGSLAIRLLLSLFKAVEYGGDDSLSLRTWRFFASRDMRHESKDFWYPFWLGVVELGAFPFLMKARAWLFVGAWIGFKTVPQWGRWQDRNVYNRFMIGTALILLGSYALSVLCLD